MSIRVEVWGDYSCQGGTPLLGVKRGRPFFTPPPLNPYP